MKHLRFVLPLVVGTLVFMACQAKLPQAEVDAATAAYEAAKTAQAEVYAPESFKAASDAYTALQDNLNAKEYGKTKALATALLEASQKAKADAEAALEAAKAEVATLVNDINTLLPVVQAELALAAKAGKKAKVDVKAYQDALTAGAQVFADAQASTDYADAKTKLQGLKDSLVKAQQELEAAGYKNN